MTREVVNVWCGATCLGIFKCSLWLSNRNIDTKPRLLTLHSINPTRTNVTQCSLRLLLSPSSARPSLARSLSALAQ